MRFVENQVTKTVFAILGALFFEGAALAGTLNPQNNIWDTSGLKQAKEFCERYTVGSGGVAPHWNDSTKKCVFPVAAAPGLEQLCTGLGGTFNDTATPKCALSGSSGLPGIDIQAGHHVQVARVTIPPFSRPQQKVVFPRRFQNCAKLVPMISRQRFWGEDEEMAGIGALNEEFFSYEGNATNHTDKSMHWLVICIKN